MKFVGRGLELAELNLLLRKKSASLVVIRGRRRIGKSRLIEEFAKDKKSWVFSGLPPVQGMTKQRQLDLFAEQMSQILRMPKLQASSWGDLFWHLGHHIKDQRLIIVFDEISWMGSEDPDFLGQLKNAWDLHFSKNSKVMCILCGSVSSWIEENILSSTSFLGRISSVLTLGELPLEQAQEFWGKQKNKVSSFEKFKILAVTGGVPKYLEEIIPEESAEANIRRLCFQPKGLLFREFDQIFSDLFSSKAAAYSKIVGILAKKSSNLDEICRSLQVEKSGATSENLRDLILAGFASEDCTWNLKSKQISKLKRFRLSDNYLRFYVKYVQPNKGKIAKNIFESPSLYNLPGWEAIMGLQFENLVLNNFKQLCKLIQVDLRDVIMAGPFFQRKNNRQKGCQIDLLIQAKHQTLYVCEIKFHMSPIQSIVIHQVEEKIKRLSYPRGFSIRPILIHVNGVSQAVIASEFFTHIIDFSDL